jgi:hypothetical protein
MLVEWKMSGGESARAAFGPGYSAFVEWTETHNKTTRAMMAVRFMMIGMTWMDEFKGFGVNLSGCVSA